MQKIKIKHVVEGLEKNSYANTGDAGIDLRASGRWIINLDSDKKEIGQGKYEISPGERILIKTGIQVEIPKGFWGNIRDRSGMAFDHGLHILAGVVDETYRGEVGVVMINLGTKSYILAKNERIAQMVITPYAASDISYEEKLGDSHRGENGFGSSGK